MGQRWKWGSWGYVPWGMQAVSREGAVLSPAGLEMTFSGFWKLLDLNLVQASSLCLHLPHSRPLKA